MLKFTCVVAIALVGLSCFASPPGLTLMGMEERWKDAPKGGLEAPLVLKVPGMDQVAYGSVEYQPGRKLDIYYPGGYDFKKALPVVVLVMGYSTAVTTKWFGAKLKDIGQYISWGQLVAAKGMICVAYETDFPDDDIDYVLDFILDRGKAYGMDGKRIGLFTCSGNTITALGALAAKDRRYAASLKCGVVFYPIISYFQTNNPDMNMVVPFQRQLRKDVPVFMVTIGQEVPVWKQAAADFLALAAARAYPVQSAYFEKGTHGFDTDVDSEESRAIIAQAADFLKAKLGQ
jgi:dienelactone hydrolase